MPDKKQLNKRGGRSPQIEATEKNSAELSFWLSLAFADTIKRYCEITMKKDDVTPLHAIAMFYLVRREGTCTPTQLAELMFRSKHSVTKIVDNLEKEGLIVRDFSSKDRRVTRIKVTDVGREYVKKNLQIGNKRAKSVMDCLSAGEQNALVALARKMCDRMTSILDNLG
jgi:DNA-binding MarR family transcriptional regulator